VLSKYPKTIGISIEYFEYFFKNISQNFLFEEDLWSGIDKVPFYIPHYPVKGNINMICKLRPFYR